MDGQEGSDDGPDEPEEERRRRALVWFLIALLLVLLVLGGASALGVFSSGGTGELTAQVTDQNGDPASGQEVQILDPRTGEVIATAITDEDGEAEFTLDQGEYDVVVGDSTREVTLGDATTVDLSVNLAPPEPGETTPSAFVRATGGPTPLEVRRIPTF